MIDQRRFLILLVLDGFGCRKEARWNAIAEASTPTFDRLFRGSAWTELEASGLSVGLPEGQMGNSEVGHLNMGAGRVVDQEIVRITRASSEMFRNAALTEALVAARDRGSSVHFVGLLSDGGVHSLQQHLDGLIEASLVHGLGLNGAEPDVFVHAILDGRDTPPRSAVANIERLQRFIEDKPGVRLSTIVGRYYTMDRDKRWERTRRGYDLMTRGEGKKTPTPTASVDELYASDVTDEFMEPLAVVDGDGKHRGTIRDGDAVVFFNFRADRMRQIVTAFRDDGFSGFERIERPRVKLYSMTRYHQDFDLPVLFPPLEVKNHLGEVFAKAGIRQLRIAETEKYAHVTFFFNGGSDEVSEGEERLLIPSPRVATYDLQPEMSVVELSVEVARQIESRKFGVIVMNIANPDMVGHTGKMDSAVLAVEATDAAIARILAAVDAVDGVAVITADHGNCELMFDEKTGQPHTAHTTNPVPLIVYDSGGTKLRLRSGGALCNVAPTVLEILGIEKPAEMTAESLILHPNG